MLPKWIVDVLDRELPNLKGGERDRVAEALYEAAVGSKPLQAAITEAIANSAKTVLEQHAIRDGDGFLAGEVARKSTQTVLFALGEA